MNSKQSSLVHNVTSLKQSKCRLIFELCTINAPVVVLYCVQKKATVVFIARIPTNIAHPNKKRARTEPRSLCFLRKGLRQGFELPALREVPGIKSFFSNYLNRTDYWDYCFLSPELLYVTIRLLSV